MDVGESLTERAKEACELLAEKYGTEFMDVSIVMKKETYLFYCDISAKSSSGNSYYAVNESDNPIASFLGAIQKLDLQMRKKKKNNRCSCKGMRVEINSYDNSLEAEERAPVIIAEILDDLPLMSVSDATNNLNNQKRVFVFENISNNAVNVVYKRGDGNFGWIDYKIKR
jgi:ribosome-associated translation inhibitor RaiA